MSRRPGGSGLTAKAPSRSRSLQSVSGPHVCPLVRSMLPPLRLAHARCLAEALRFASRERLVRLLAVVVSTAPPCSNGKVLAVRGAVVDIGFEPADLPPLDEALTSNGTSRKISLSRFRPISTSAPFAGLRFKPLPAFGAGRRCAEPEIRSRCRSETPCSAAFSMSRETFATAGRRYPPTCRARQSIERRHRSGTAVRRRRYSKPASK